MEHILFIILISCIVIQSFYYLYFYFPLYFFKSKNISENLNSVPFSIVVCVHNNLIYLKELIPVLMAQKAGAFEVIIVNDRSEDEIFEYLYLESKKHPTIKVVNILHTPNGFNSKKYALFLGIKAAKYDQLLLTDSDCLPASDQWAVKMNSVLSDSSEIVLGYSPYMNGKSFLSKFIHYETLLTGVNYLSFAIKGFPYMGVGRNLLYKKSVFMKQKCIARYRNLTGGDDDLLINRSATSSNTGIMIDVATHVHSHINTNYRSWFIQKIRHLSVGKYYTLKSKISLGLNLVAQLLFYVITVILLCHSYKIELIGYLIIGRTLLIVLILYLMIRKLKDRTHWFLIPLFDFLYCLYYLVVGLFAIVDKKIRWS